MRDQPRRDTLPELALRRLLHKRGYRYRVGFPVPGKPRRTIDIAFTRKRVAVFVDGCYWHRCPKHYVSVKNNSAWWQEKLENNVLRDRDTDRHLSGLGWLVLRVWEHEEVDAAAGRVQAALAGR